MILQDRDTVLFDLDGTLLPFRQEDFVHDYFGRLVRKAMPLGFDKDTLVKAVWAGTGAMVENDGSKSNCQAFWEVFTHLTGRDREELEPVFLEFYQKEFDQVREVLQGPVDRSGLIRELRRRGCGLILATNPLFPPEAVETRLRWAGRTSADFDHITTYDNSCHCKPNPDYFRDILADTGRRAEQCVMVGNNAREDMVAGNLGMAVYLVTDHPEDCTDADLARYPHGSFAEMEAWLLG